MLLSPLAAVAVQVPLLVAVGAVLLQGEPILRWRRVLLLGLAWLLVEALVHRRGHRSATSCGHR